MEARDAMAGEVEHLAGLWQEGWRDAHEQIVPAELARLRTFDSFRERMQAGLAETRVVGPAGAPTGFYMLKADELYQLYVSAAARGTGVAAILIADAEARIARSGAAIAWLACAIGNTRAARFYEKHGWQRIELESPRPLAVFRNPRVMARYRVLHDIRPAHDADEALGLLKKLDPGDAAVVEGWSSESGAVPGEARVEVIAYRPETVELSVRTGGPGVLVAAESWAPGWTASVNGRPAQVLPANVAFIGVPLPAGDHRVTLAYRPASFYRAAAVSMLAWLAVAVVSCLA